MRLVFERPLAAAGLDVRVVEPAARPDDVDRWLAALLRGDEIAGTVPFQTSHGWPAVMATAMGRVAVRYDFDHLVAGVVITSDSSAQLAAASAEVEAYLRSARPDFSGDVVTLIELWQ